MKKQGKQKKNWKNSIRLVFLILCGAVLGVNVYLANANRLVGNQLPMPFGYGAAVVLSGSMEPELSKSDLIIVKRTEAYELNDVVVFQDKDTLVVHRIIFIDGKTVITQGDANNVEDEPMEISVIKGEVVGVVPGAGAVVDFFKSPVGILLTIAVAILLVELSHTKQKQKDMDELDKIKEEIRKLKEDI